MHVFGKDGLQFKVKKDFGHLPLLLPKFLTKVKDMPDTITQLLCRAMSWYRDIIRFTAKTIIFIKKIAYE